MIMDWFVEIKERARHLWPGTWTVSGWHGDEHAAYKKAEIAWDQKQAQCFEENPRPPSQDGSLDIIDDYFSWNVTTPHWSLHKDGLWYKGLKKDSDPEEHNKFSGVFLSKEAAEKVLADHPNSRPPKIENYQEELDNAAEPFFCKKDWWKY